LPTAPCARLLGDDGLVERVVEFGFVDAVGLGQPGERALHVLLAVTR